MAIGIATTEIFLAADNSITILVLLISISELHGRSNSIGSLVTKLEKELCISTGMLSERTYFL